MHKRHLQDVYNVPNCNLELHCLFCLFGRPSFNLALFGTEVKDSLDVFDRKWDCPYVGWGM
jgi:hypothetical protein